MGTRRNCPRFCLIPPLGDGSRLAGEPAAGCVPCSGDTPAVVTQSGAEHGQRGQPAARSCSDNICCCCRVCHLRAAPSSWLGTKRFHFTRTERKAQSKKPMEGQRGAVSTLEMKRKAAPSIPRVLGGLLQRDGRDSWRDAGIKAGMGCAAVRDLTLADP